jgi:hypothetical protein
MTTSTESITIGTSTLESIFKQTNLSININWSSVVSNSEGDYLYALGSLNNIGSIYYSINYGLN